MNMYGYVGNSPIRFADHLGLEPQTSSSVPDGFAGTFSEMNAAGYHASRAASMNTARDRGQREFCGIICCRGRIYIVPKPHAEPARKTEIANNIEHIKGGRHAIHKLRLERLETPDPEP